MRRGRYVSDSDLFYDREKRHPFRFLFRLLAVFLVIAAVLTGVVSLAMGSRIELKKETVTISNLPADLENWTILVLDDMNGKILGTDQSTLLSTIGQLRVSTILFTGDMLGSGGNVEPLLTLLDGLPQDTVKLYLPGDADGDVYNESAHGDLSVYSSWAQKLQEKGVIILDEPVSFTRARGGTIWFVPSWCYTLDLDAAQKAYTARYDALQGSLTNDQYALRRVLKYRIELLDRVKAVKKAMTEKEIQIAVTHVPVTAQEMNDVMRHQDRKDQFSLRNADLIVSGHYAAGQWRIPGVGALWVPDLGFFPEDRELTGMSSLSGVPQYISPGLAASTYYPPWMRFRLLNSPAATVITLSAYLH